MHSWPLAASVTRKPSGISMPASIWRCTGWSSTTSKVRWLPKKPATWRGGSASGPGSSISRRYNRTLKVVPCCGTLVSDKSPPISAVSKPVMVKPSPVPGSPRRRPAAPRSKGKNMRCWSCSATPMPVSTMSKRITSRRQSTCSVTEPVSVKLTALLSKLMMICRSRLASACTQVGMRPLWV